MRHYEESVPIQAAPKTLFAFVDNHSHLSSHMGRSSWMMGGGRMKTETDEGRGRTVGSHIRMSGNVLGIKLFLDEVIIQREPPRLKVWETIGTPRLLVIGQYRMGLEISDENGISRLRVFIDYGLPAKNAWLGKLFGGVYAKWCVRQMLQSAREKFKKQR